VSFQAGKPQADPEKVEKVFGIKLPTETPSLKVVSMDDLIKAKAQKVQAASAPVEDAKDRKIRELEQQVAQLQHELEVATDCTIYEEDLQFPEHFYNVHEDENLIVPVVELTEEEIQKIVDELKGLEVPEYSFIAHRVGDTLAIKMHDDRGITYVITKDYYEANVE
jgi:hypothetical protein